MLGIASINGKLLAVFEASNCSVFSINSVESSDGGETWGDRRRVYTAVGEKSNTGAPQLINVGGILVCSFMTDEDSETKKWFDNAWAKLVVSSDRGKTWGKKLEWSGVQSTWLGMMVLDDSSFLGLVQHDKDIVVQRILI